jgi:predicted amidohydrolase YtcJ
MLILHNANIYTLNTQQPYATAILIDRERIVALGDERAMEGWPLAATRQDLQGRAVIPGLVDAHLHLEQYALSLQVVDCETDTRQECLLRIAERTRSAPGGDWILGHGWNQTRWPEGFGSAVHLDAVAPHHPVYLTAKSLHAGWANSTALRLAGIGAATPDPPKGRLGRNPDGSPSGILFEDATQLVERVIPQPALEEVVEALRQALPYLAAMGLTGVHDFDSWRCFMALQDLYTTGELKIRVLKNIRLEDFPHAAALVVESGFGDDLLRLGGVKLFADGALGPLTAAMIQPYEGEPDNRGMLMLDAEQLVEHGRLAAESGLSLAVHAIGDRAVHEVLDGFEQLRREEAGMPARPKLRHRIEHVQLIHPSDAGRLAKLDVIASMQPIHAPSDMWMADRYWGERTALAYAWRTQLAHGATLAFGSDAPVESPNPFWGLHAAVTRRRPDGSPGPDGWHPEQRLSRLEALQAFTTGSAYAAGMEDRQGKLAPGYLADLLVLDVDPFNCDPEVLRDIRPIATIVGGEWVNVQS